MTLRNKALLFKKISKAVYNFTVKSKIDNSKNIQNFFEIANVKTF